MNYFYDVVINMNEGNPYNFYEWESFDPIELVKKIPLFRVSTKTFNDFCLYDLKVDKEFLNTILDKTLLKNNKINKTINYACLLCDTKNSLVVEFDEEGKIISRSCLLLEDDLNVIEIIYNYKEMFIGYQKVSNLKLDTYLRQEKIVKKVVKVEVDTLVKKNNVMKLKYLFNELFGYEEDNIKNMKEKIYNSLDGEILQKTKNIYNLILLSYNKS